MTRLHKAVCTLATGALTITAGIGAVALDVSTAHALTSQGENIIERPAGTVTADSLPTAQINKGVVWDQVIVGDTVYVGGEFAHARPAGAAVDTQMQPRKNLMAYDVTTGALKAWNPAAAGQVDVLAVSPDKSRLYVGGNFTTIDGATKTRLAAFDTATGKLVDGFSPVVDGRVTAIAATNSTVYIGGFFATVNGVSRTRLAAVNAATGALLNWKPTADSYVRGMALNNDGTRVVIGGSFAYVNNSYAPGMASIDPATGASQPWAANRTIVDSGDHSGMYSLRNNGNSIVVTGWSWSRGGNFEGVASIDQNTGAIKWMADCHGDSYDSTTLGGIVYAASHHHTCENVGLMPEQKPKNHQRLDAWQDKATGTVKTNREVGYSNNAGNPAPTAVSWWPQLNTGTYTGQAQGAWSMASDDRYVVAGGEFTTVNGQLQQGLARFAVDSIAPKKMGPHYADAQPTADIVGRTVRFQFQANADLDGIAERYDVYRQADGGEPELAGSLTQDSTYWNRPMLSFTDQGAKPNTTYTYWATAVDGDGNQRKGTKVKVTTAEAAAASAYGDTVLLDGPTHYWRMEEASGTTVSDSTGSSPLSLRTGATLGQPSRTGLGNDLTTTGGYGVTTKAEATTSAVTVEAWVKTTSTAGGLIADFGSSTGNASTYSDRPLYLTATGQVGWGIDDGRGGNSLLSATRVNDGQWHLVTGTLSNTAGQALYVDGKLVARDTTMLRSVGMNGYWHVGCDRVSGWASAPVNKCLNGAIDEVATFNEALSATQVAAHFAAAQPNKAPTAAFTATCDANGLCALDASGTSDADGQVVRWDWKFDDGTTATGRTATHTFTSGGQHDITLVVTDDRGAATTLTKTVDVTLPNKAPVAAFKASCASLDCVLDGNASTDPDGTISRWDWNFGDGTTGTGKEASHTYAAAGSYTVTLTVTDDKGATATSTNQVVASQMAATVKTVASDDFAQARTRWGNAPVGGTYTYGTPSAFTTDGSTGLVAATKGVTARATLAAAQVTDSISDVDITLPQLPVGGPAYIRLEARTTATNGYWGYVRVTPDGTASLTLARRVDGVQTDLKSVALPAVAAGQTYRLELDVKGVGTTTLSASLWAANGSKPASPLVSATDTTAALQTVGAPAVSTYLASTATAPATVSFDNLQVVGN